MQNTLVVFDKSGSAQTFTASPEQTLIDAINEAECIEIIKHYIAQQATSN